MSDFSDFTQSYAGHIAALTEAGGAGVAPAAHRGAFDAGGAAHVFQDWTPEFEAAIGYAHAVSAVDAACAEERLGQTECVALARAADAYARVVLKERAA